MEEKKNLQLKCIPRSYAQVFFSDYVPFGWLLLIVSLMDWVGGISGLLAVMTANGVAWLLGFSKEQINKGLYGYNTVLVGLGTGLLFQPCTELFLIVFFAALFTLFLTLALEGILYKYNLPFLSISFMIGMWMITLASRQFEALGISERGIYRANELYTIGGNTLVWFFDQIQLMPIPQILRTYLLSMGAIFFQSNLLAGLLITIGLLLFSRIAFSLSALGFAIAWGFYQLTGANPEQMSYTYIGFNYILTAIAIGGLFLVPSPQSYLWSLLLLPIVVMLTIAFSIIFGQYHLSVYSLPFNIIVLTFLYTLKLRQHPDKGPKEVPLQENSPEQNLYYSRNNDSRFAGPFYLPVTLPFFGEWSISQGHSGNETHRDEWKYAWDFVLTDDNGSRFKNEGLTLTDYYCYGKAITAPADGTIAELATGIPDNVIGDVNTAQNWGNTVVIKHSDYLYSKLCHLQNGTIKVKKGEFIKQGQTIGQVGNSGRSPYPHLHMQFQVIPNIGAPTFQYPFSQYICKNKNKLSLRSFSIPKENELVSNIRETPLLKNALHFIPGQQIRFRITENSIERFRKLPPDAHWIVNTTSQNESRIISATENATAWIYNDNHVHYFSHFRGDKKTLLFQFFCALYKVQFGYYEQLTITDHIPPNLIFRKSACFLHDFVAPFTQYLKADYQLRFVSIDDTMLPSVIKLESQLVKKVFATPKETTKFIIHIGKEGISSFEVIENNQKLVATCEEFSSF